VGIRDDLTYAVRSLRKTPGLVSVIVLTLALGIGIHTAAFNLLPGLARNSSFQAQRARFPAPP
jgi:hypothetical protein